MADVAGLKDRLVAEMRARIKEDDSSVPSPDGPYAYGIRFAHGAEHPMLVRADRDGQNETVLLDANALRRRQGVFPSRRQRPQPRPPAPRLGQRRDGLGIFRDPHSRSCDRRRPARPYSRHLGRAGVGGGFAHPPLCLARRQPPSGQGLPPHGRHRSRRRTWLSSRTATRPISSASARPSRTGSSSSTATTTRLRRCTSSTADDPAGTPRLVAPRRPAERYELDDSGGLFYILTNAGDAEDFKIVTAPVATPGREHWRDLVPHRDGRLILSVTAYKDWLVRLEREGGLPRIVIRHLATGEEHAYRLRRGGLFARADGRLRVRHQRRSASPTRR